MDCSSPKVCGSPKPVWPVSINGFSDLGEPTLLIGKGEEEEREHDCLQVTKEDTIA